jgi:integrase
MRRFNSGPRLQFLLVEGNGVTRFGRATVSESVSNSVWGRFTRSEFADTPLKLACCSLTRACLDALRFWRTTMKSPFTLFRRGKMFYCQNAETGQQLSLKTRDQAAAQALLHARNESHRQPILNLQMARTYLTASDPEISGRTWQASMDEMAKTKTGVTLKRHHVAMQDKAFDLIRDVAILETQAGQLMKVLGLACVSTNIFLRRLHNFSLDMGWLPWPILAKKRWPKIHFKEKRAVTAAEHDAITTGEANPERRAYYECCWHLGAAQTDVANLNAEDIDWNGRVVSFHRQKTGMASVVRFGGCLEVVLRTLPLAGPLFPNHRLKVETHRSREFSRACKRCGISGISLHSYRYAWAERARTAGYPERFAQEALGHASKAVHRAYAKKAQVIIPALEEYERRQAETDEAVVLAMPAAVA